MFSNILSVLFISIFLTKYEHKVLTQDNFEHKYLHALVKLATVMGIEL